MSGMLLRLAGPLQSWGERSAFAPERDGAPCPTRSGLVGMFAAAQGLARDTALRENPYAEIDFTVRADRPGTLLTDFHTAGGGRPDRLTAATSGGKHKGDAVITRRQYLTDAVFVVAVTGPEDVLAPIRRALRQPHWAPYLGRRSCAPDEPFLLREHVDDPVAELRGAVPLSDHAGHHSRRYARLPAEELAKATIPVTFYWEHKPDTNSADIVTLTAYDLPLSFAQHGRSHGKRTLYRTVEHLPANLLVDERETQQDADTAVLAVHPPRPRTVHQRLIDYAMKETVA